MVHNDRRIYIIESLDNNYEIERELNKFASLIKVPEGIHTYELDEYSLWSSAALGMKYDHIILFLQDNCKNIVSDKIKIYIKNKIKEFWTIKLEYVSDNKVILEANDNRTIKELIIKIRFDKAVELSKAQISIISVDELTVVLECKDIYSLKEFLINNNIYIDEIIGNIKDIKVKVISDLYDYQVEAVNAFISGNRGIIKGRGVISMPPGSGKTLVGLKIIEYMKVKTLILVENKESFNCWLEELKDKTNLGANSESLIKYNELNSSISIITYREAQELLTRIKTERWGLIIYDDAHKLPGPKSKILGYISSRYKLALGSILKREDNRHYIIYKAVGPKIYNLTLRELEIRGIQIEVICTEVKIPQNYWDFNQRVNEKELLREAKNQNKIEIYKLLEGKHKNSKIVLVSTYKEVAYKFHDIICDSTLIVGKTNPNNRQILVEEYNSKNVGKLIASELLEKLQINNIDVLISLSYIGKSEREEYLRIGKLKSSNLNKHKVAYYYALVSENTCEDRVFKKRSQDMVKHGYKFKIIYYRSYNKGI
ncbi:helicase-associated domain-containing protein [Clostridium estertheticum]|uniref:DEAD/DEAH box helicase family protein n=1 Tax=Clostridium estertheticum TaxID=238834 RepID=UPI0013EECBF4|nr:DEAD/DEAH box helicase family protein [Clostridium estertheticum]MBZ9606528.1 helicase-associated domain-containing protein [Clostridium estertheticum]